MVLYCFFSNCLSVRLDIKFDLKLQKKSLLVYHHSAYARTDGKICRLQLFQILDSFANEKKTKF